MEEEDVLTFERIRNVRKEEMNNDTLAEIENDFFEKVEQYLSSKKRISSQKSSREYENAKKMVEDIIDNRIKKLMRYAFLSTKTSIPSENLIEHEKKVFKDIESSVSKHREFIVNKVTPGSEDKETVNEEEEMDDNENEKEESSKESLEDDNNENNFVEEDEEEKEEVLFDASKKEENSNEKEEENYEKDTNIVFRTKQEIDEFIGPDMDTYGPFEKDEELELEDDIGKLLLKQGKVEKIEK